MAEHGQVGFVVIGRNEGRRLQAGLRAIQQYYPLSTVVYVDSGSTDDSVAFTQSLGMMVVELDTSIPFTAARARNAGAEALLHQNGNTQFIQFMDGDCEVARDWIDSALEVFEREPQVAIVSGRRAEKFIHHSIYNRLMDIEWDTPIGETKAVLGDMCVRVPVFQRIGGFSVDIIAAEDDDICLRARAAGYRICRVDAPMSQHDANILKLTQWYQRSKRGGYGFANIFHRHGGAPEYYFRRELISVVLWGAFVPLLFIVSALLMPVMAFWILLLYFAQIAKTMWWRLRAGDDVKTALIYSVLIVTGKVAEFFGVMQYVKNCLFSRQHRLIEYK